MATTGDDPVDRLTDFIADEIERSMNTGHRIYAVDRTALRVAYRAVRNHMLANHDPGDEDRSER